jgi:hypothetical protein
MMGNEMKIQIVKYFLKLNEVGERALGKYKFISGSLLLIKGRNGNLYCINRWQRKQLRSRGEGV